MAEITVDVPASNKVARAELAHKLALLRRRGLMDAGLVLVQNGGMLQGYIAEGELAFGLETVGDAEDGDLDLSMFVDRTPAT
ncbi:hypothetical protein LTR60_007016, partial [Cryomyces antarcticus]